jgi:hypothetical protein
MPEVITRVSDLLDLALPSIARTDQRAVGPSPPRTLLDLSCSLTI